MFLRYAGPPVEDEDVGRYYFTTLRDARAGVSGVFPGNATA